MNTAPILKAYKNGMPLDMLAKEFGISLHEVIDILYGYQIKCKKIVVVSTPESRKNMLEEKYYDNQIDRGSNTKTDRS